MAHLRFRVPLGKAGGTRSQVFAVTGHPDNLTPCSTSGWTCRLNPVEWRGESGQTQCFSWTPMFNRIDSTFDTALATCCTKPWGMSRSALMMAWVFPSLAASET